MGRIRLALLAILLLAAPVGSQPPAPLPAPVSDEPSIAPLYRFGSTWFRHGDKAYTVAFTPDGKQLITGHGDHSIRFWDVTSGNEVRRLQGHTQFVRSLAIAPDGHILASASGDKTVRLWDAQTGKQLREFSDHTGWAFCVAISPDGKTLASGGNDGLLVLRDTATGKLRSARAGTRRAHHGTRLQPRRSRAHDGRP